MGIVTPIKKLLSGETVVGLSEFQTGDVIPVENGGTGSTTVDSAISALKIATGTTKDLKLLVTKDTPLAGDSTTYDEIYTTIQAAVDSLPAIINHAVTIYIRKGTTAYDEVVTVQRVVAGGSITIRGEYYWYGTNASSKTGKIDLGGSDFGYADMAQIAAGDKIWLLKYSGAVEASVPSEYVVDTVASVNGAEITLTTNSGKSFDTSWTYQIVKTAISPSSGDALTVQFTDNVSIEGLSLNGGTNVLRIISCRTIKAACVACYGTSSYRMLFRSSTSDATTGIYRCLVEIPSTGRGIIVSTTSNVFFYNLVIHSTSSSSFVYYTTGMSYSTVRKGGIIPAGGVGVFCQFNSVVYFENVLNNATCPKSPASSADASYIL